MSARKRRRRRAVAGVLIGVLALLAVGTAGVAWEVRTKASQLQNELTVNLQTAQAQLEAGKNSLRLANDNHDTKFISEAKAHFGSAREQFQQSARLVDTSRLLGALESIPAVGGEVRSRHTAVDAIAEMGVQISTAGLDLADLEGQLIAPSGKDGQQGHTLLTVLNQTDSSLSTVQGELQKAKQAAARVDIAVLPANEQATFIKARGTIDVALGAVAEFKQLVPIFVEVLGGNGIRTYLVEQVNPAELRAGGGFIGTYSLIRADHGSLKLIASGDAGSISVPRPSLGQPGYIAPPGPLSQLLIKNSSWSFDDSNFYPDFPSNARAGEQFAGPRLHTKIDGVIAMDYYTVAAILSLTGPITVPGVGSINANNFVSTVVSLDINNSPQHKLIVSAIAGPLMDRVSSLPPAQWPNLLHTLDTLASSRSLQAYFNNSTVETEIDQFGWSGTQKTTSATEYMMEVESNLGATKANYFVSRHYTVVLSRNGTVLHHVVTIDVVNSMPYQYRPIEFYRDYVRLYVSPESSHLKTNITPMRLGFAAAPGTQMIDGWVTILGYGHRGHIVFQYDTPWKPNGRSEEQIYWQKQPGTLNDTIQVIWVDGNGHTYTTNGDLAQDRVITLSTRGVSLVKGQIGTAHLPSLSL